MLGTPYDAHRPDLSGETLDGRNKLVSFEKFHSATQKVTHKSEILAVEASPAAHPYYSIITILRKKKALRVYPAETRLTVYRRSVVSDLDLFFFVAEWNFSKLTNSFGTLVFFIHTYGYCAFAREGFIEFGGQDAENERSEVS